MMLPLREIDILGVFVAPVAVCLALAGAGTWALVGVLRHAKPAAVPAVLELSIFLGLLSGLVLLLGRV